jgi:hypothetical protein
MNKTELLFHLLKIEFISRGILNSWFKHLVAFILWTYEAPSRFVTLPEIFVVGNFFRFIKTKVNLNVLKFSDGLLSLCSYYLTFVSKEYNVFGVWREF